VELVSLSPCGGKAVKGIRHNTNFRYSFFPKIPMGGCCLVWNKMLSAITFSMLFIFYLVALRSYIASARQNGN